MATPTFVGSSTRSADGALTKPAGTVDGDLVLIFCTSNSSGSYTTPTGFTILSARTGVSGASFILFQRTVSGDGASWAVASSSTGYWLSIVLRGQDSTQPDAGPATAASLGAPSVTAVAADSLLVCFWGCLNSVTMTPPASMTKRGGFAGTRSNMVATEDLTASGATGTRTRAAGGSYPGALTVTIKPVPSGGDPARDADMLAFF